MEGPDDTRRRIVGGLISAPAWAGVALGALGAGCSGLPAVPAPPGAEPLPAPALRVGDRWRYRLTDLYTGAAVGEAQVEVVATAPELRVRVDRGDGRPALEELYTDAWTVVAETIYDAPVRFEAPMPVVPPGARTGLRASTRTRYRSEYSSRALDWSQRLRVVGWERVEVPAGTFDALRIERMIDFAHPDFFRFGAERIDVLWYAPQVGRWVLREWTGSYMPGSPVPQRGRAREERTRWSLVAWQPAAR